MGRPAWGVSLPCAPSDQPRELPARFHSGRPSVHCTHGCSIHPCNFGSSGISAHRIDCELRKPCRLRTCRNFSVRMKTGGVCRLVFRLTFAALGAGLPRSRGSERSVRPGMRRGRSAPPRPPPVGGGVSPYSEKGLSLMNIASIRSRVMNDELRSKIMSAEQAASLIPSGSTVGMSGFTGSGYPKAVPLELAKRIDAAHARGEPFKISVWTGASTAPELDGALAKVDAIQMRLPYQSDPNCRKRINAGAMGLHRHPSQPRRPIRVVRLPRPARCRGGRGRRYPAGRPADPVVVDRQQQDLARSGRPHHPRGELAAELGARRHARHLLRHRSAAASQADPAGGHRRIASASPISAAIPPRSSPSSRPMPAIATTPSPRPTRPPSRSPPTSSSSSTTR